MTSFIHQMLPRKIKPLWNCYYRQIFFFLLCLFAYKRGNIFLQSSFATAKMHAHMDVCKGKVGRWKKKSKTWPALKPWKELDMDKRQLPSSPTELQPPDCDTVVTGERRHGPSSPAVMGWFGWSENFYQTRILRSLSPGKAKGKQPSFLLGFSLFGVLILSSS